MRSDSGGERWDPPGRDSGHAPGAAVTRENGPLTVFPGWNNLVAPRPYSKFEAYAILNHDGDMHAASEALHSEGFGVFRERDMHGNQIVRCGKYSYTWPADREPLAVGDKVLLPPAPAPLHEVYDDKPWQAEVTQIGTGYGGTLREVVRLVTRAQPA